MKQAKRIMSVLVAVVILLGVVPVMNVGMTANALTPTYSVSSGYASSTYYTKLCNVSLTGNQREDIIAVAQSQYGYHEGNNSSQLSGNYNGSGNYTEYGYWYGLQDEWCAMFVSWCARQAGIPTSILKNSTCAGVGSSNFNLSYKDGSSYTPQKGDLFFTKEWTHVGLVASVNGSTFTTIEGNSSNSVTSNTYKVSNYYFGIPNYAATSAPTYATISTNRYSYEVNERVYFSMSADGTINNLWIYCPNGQTLTYKDVGTEYDLGFGMSGEFEALVQTWNSIGNYTSERIHFLVGDPTRAILTTDHTSYAVDERVYFTCDTNGSPNCNTLWIYCPNGDKLHYSDIGAKFDLGFGMSGEFEALVQAWSRTGSLTSERIRFIVGSPTRATIQTNKQTYAIGEEIQFTCDTNGSENCNCVWIYGPDGSKMSYTKVGTQLKVTINKAGTYEALVQAWNRAGSLTSERISFAVGDSHVHSYTASVTKAATCTADGTRTYTCSCGASYTEVITKLGHSFGVWTKLNDTQHQRVCSRDSSHVEKANHTWNSGTVTKAATCTQTGTKTYTCTLCNATKTETIPVNASNHINTVNVAATAPTCTVKGYTSGVYCNDCKKYISGHQEQPLAAHTLTTVNQRAATCTAEGYTGDRYCTTCKQTISTGSTIAKKAHTITIINKKDATYDAEGYTGDEYCTVCKQTIKSGTVIPKLEKPSDPAPSNPQPSGSCKWCGQNHGGAFGWLVKIIHNILAAILGARY